MRRVLTLLGLILVVRALPVHGAESVPEAYARIKPAIVRVWVFNAKGVPIKSGTGLIVASANGSSTVLTSEHVVDGGTSVRVDVSRELHDLRAGVIAVQKGIDLALLRIPVAGLHTATFATRSTVEGATVAAAGYGAAVSDASVRAGLPQGPQLLFPGTVSALPAAAGIVEISGILVQPGMSGGAVFDPATAQVLGIIEARLPQEIGVAISVPNVALAFLAAQHVRVATSPTIMATALPARPPVALAPRTPAPTPPPAPRPQHTLQRAEAPAYGCAYHNIAKVETGGSVVTISDGSSYGIVDSYSRIQASLWSTGDAVRVCVSRLSGGSAAASIENPSHYARLQARVLAGGTGALPVSCTMTQIAGVATGGGVVTTSDGNSYEISDSYSRIQASLWATGDSVRACLTRMTDGTTAASLQNPAHYAKLQAQLIRQSAASSVVCRDSRIHEVSGGLVQTVDGRAYAVSDSYMQIQISLWSTGEDVRVCTSRMRDGSIFASIKNPTHYATVQGVER